MSHSPVQSPKINKDGPFLAQNSHLGDFCNFCSTWSTLGIKSAPGSPFMSILISLNQNLWKLSHICQKGPKHYHIGTINWSFLAILRRELLEVLWPVIPAFQWSTYFHDNVKKWAQTGKKFMKWQPQMLCKAPFIQYICFQ